MTTASFDRESSRRYRKRLFVNRFNLVMSLSTMAFGMAFLLWILSVLFAKDLRPLRRRFLPR